MKNNRQKRNDNFSSSKNCHGVLSGDNTPRLFSERSVAPSLVSLSSNILKKPGFLGQSPKPRRRRNKPLFYCGAVSLEWILKSSQEYKNKPRVLGSLAQLALNFP